MAVFYIIFNRFKLQSTLLVAIDINIWLKACHPRVIVMPAVKQLSIIGKARHYWTLEL